MNTSKAAISLPKGGGDIKGIGETFAPDLFTGTGSLSVPLAPPAARDDFAPELVLKYGTGRGNGPFGLGWSLSQPRVSRKTEKGLPTYTDDDVFLLSGMEDLVPQLDPSSGAELVQERQACADWSHDQVVSYSVARYRPRREGAYPRIERWTRVDDGDVHWRVTTREGVTSLYGRDRTARRFDPRPGREDRVFEWLLQETFDGKGNHMVYEYVRDPIDLRLPEAYEQRRLRGQLYLRRILYGNTSDKLPATKRVGPRRTCSDHGDPERLRERHYVFEVLFDYHDLPDEPAIPHDWSAEREDFAGPDWPVRGDRFSTFRPGFEIRTLRLCRRVLYLHHFAEGGLDGSPLVRGIELEYAQDAHTKLSLLRYVKVRGYKREGTSYLSRTLPPLELGYTRFRPGEQRYEPVSAHGGDFPPKGLSDPAFALLDIGGNGLPDVLSTTPGRFHYWENTGDGRIQRRHPPHAHPAGVSLADPDVAVGDLEGNGLPDLIVNRSGRTGFYEADPERGWRPFKPFDVHPTFDLSDPNLRLVDLTGDGLSDLLITGRSQFLWSRCLGKNGYASFQAIERVHDLDRFPDVYFAEAGRVRLADMTGDGLKDIVLIHASRIDYWPNLGYGRFGERVTMSNTPPGRANFDPRRVALADLNGTGCADWVYVDVCEVRAAFNQSGNGFSDEVVVSGTPMTIHPQDVEVADFYGSGTGALVWSKTAVVGRGPNYRVLDLTGGRKPFLLDSFHNNMGRETRIHYATSTRFMVKARAAGLNWRTTLPFPVHVVERVVTTDRIAKNRFVSRFVYHHGYFDGTEREFRGFGQVDQWDGESYQEFVTHASDAENQDPRFHVPPALTRTWFHTGGGPEQDVIFDEDYYQEPGLTPAEIESRRLPGARFPAGMTSEELRQARRSLHGAILRQELFSFDGSEREQHPYVVREESYGVRRLQEATDRPGVFDVHPAATLSLHYEREPHEPRVKHRLILAVDPYGNVLDEVDVSYGRRAPDPALVLADQQRQGTTHVVYSTRVLTSAIDQGDAYLLPQPADTRAYELTGYPESGPGRYVAEDFGNLADGSFELTVDGMVPFEEEPGPGRRARLIAHARKLYRPDDLGASVGDPDHLLPLGQVQPHALPGIDLRLTFSPSLLSKVYARDAGAGVAPLVPDPIAILPVDSISGEAGDRGAYQSSETLRARGWFPNQGEALWNASDADGHWWAPGSRVYYADKGTTPSQEVAAAALEFYLPTRMVAAWGETALVQYDDYGLLPVQTQDAAGNLATAGEHNSDGVVTSMSNDYRVLQPASIMDANRNRNAVAFDALGMVVATAVMGKPGDPEGDSLSGLDPDPSEAETLSFMADPLGASGAWLAGATTRLVHDLSAYQRTANADPREPASICTLTRELHGAAPGRIQCAVAYVDGSGRETQQKTLAEPGPVPLRDFLGDVLLDAEGQLQMSAVDVSSRWVTGSTKVLNNKGAPVLQYEPFFSESHAFEPETRPGAGSVMFYDPVGRRVATLHPNRTYEKVVFSTWWRKTYDPNDTSAPQGAQSGNPGTDADIRGVVNGYLSSFTPAWMTWYEARFAGGLGPKEQRAAEKAAVHADTPVIAHLDAMGRDFLTVARNRFEQGGLVTEESFSTRVHLDVQGRPLRVRDADTQGGDAQGRLVMRYDYDLSGRRIHQSSMEAGRRWTLYDVGGNPIRTWDSRGHSVRTVYDPLRRPRKVFSSGVDPGDPNRLVLVELLVYGEQHPREVGGNLRGKQFLHLDQSGAVFSEQYDFKGNLVQARRRIASDYTGAGGWDAVDGDPALPEDAASKIDPAALELLLDGSLEPDSHATETRFDAQNRPIEFTAQDLSVVRYRYNVAGLLNSLDVNLKSEMLGGQPVWTSFIAGTEHDPRGNRTRIEYGNGVITDLRYDPVTQRLREVLSRRDVAAFAGDCPPSPSSGWPGCHVQHLSYVYDPVGNVTCIRDDSQQTIFFRNRRIDPEAEYTFDAIYRLIEASGREHMGQAGTGLAPSSYNDAGRVGVPMSPSDGNAMTRYVERYAYDSTGNLKELKHWSSDLNGPTWTRTYLHQEPSQLEPGKTSNRLSSSVTGSTSSVYSASGSGYDDHGNMLQMPHLQELRWDARDRLQMSRRQAVDASDAEGILHQGERTWYVYDAAGQRVRKVTERQAAPGQPRTRLKERIYLGAVELYREYAADGTTITLERETLDVPDDRRTVALVETRTQGASPGPLRTYRYQLDNHLGSSCLELSEVGEIVSYEEYSPFGTTTYQAVDSQVDAAKRYRFGGKERDEESGLYYHGQRYYAPWMARWTRPDPRYLRDSTNLYMYALNNPVVARDPTGGPAWFIPVVAYLGYKALSSAAETGVEAGIAKATGDENFSVAGTFAKNMIVNSTVGLVPGASEAKIGGKVMIYTGKLALRTTGDAALDTLQGKGEFTDNLVKSGVGNLGGDALGAVAKKGVDKLIDATPTGKMKKAMKAELDTVADKTRREKGNAVATAYDRSTKEIVSSLDGPLDRKLHPLLETREKQFQDLVGGRKDRYYYKADGQEHAEINALNDALWRRQERLQRSLSEDDLAEIVFDIRGSAMRTGESIPPCSRCSYMLDGTKLTGKTQKAMKQQLNKVLKDEYGDRPF